MNLKNPIFSSIENDGVIENSATMRGVTAKTSILLVLTVISALVIMFTSYYSYSLLMISGIIGFVAIMIGRNNVNVAPVSGVVYSICEGVFIGTISGIVSSVSGFEGAVPIAILATISIFFTMLVLYSIKVVAATPTLTKVMSIAGMSIMLFLMFSVVLSLFGNTAIMDMFSENILVAVLLSLFFIAYGTFMLVFNFNEAQQYVENGFDKKYEWVAALGLIMTILYIYIQVLRFVVLIMGNRKN